MSERELTYEVRHRQQQKRATATILVALLMLFFAFWYAFSYYRASGGDETNVGASACRPFDPKVAVPANTTVNVYNASNKNGLAARTATQLKQRGFAIGKIANDPLKRSVKVVEVRHGPAGKDRAALLTPLGGKGTAQVADKRKDATVDLVLGVGFTDLGKTPTPTGKPMCASPTTSPTSNAG
ncbi:membrane protein [Knoellia sinensis KCTC 19936]|uniref:Membrane protein n=1 Tax=Knoellia sinensis KCTC 19936 TaxID=1385520 RepID=A0A0A0J0R1_9MICO|nr:LytR C-terminal domain-containing protein [Knoellia sinensis]KGN30309.1 membrane protein [Knoellia sinensis KCTC 19936]